MGNVTPALGEASVALDDAGVPFVFPSKVTVYAASLIFRYTAK